MHALANVQHNLQCHLLHEDETIINQLAKPPKGCLKDRLAIYANGYYWRLMDALQKDYQVLYNYLGDKAFAEVATAYIAAYPSRFYTIAAFTKQLPEFLLDLHPERGYLSELAALIRALSLSLEAADDPVLAYTALTAVPLQNWPSLCFKCHPSVQCLTFKWNIFSWWQALLQKKRSPKKRKENSACIVWRQELQSHAISLTHLEWVAFQALQAGSCFADVCERVYTTKGVSETAAPAFVANCVTKWLNDHIFSEVYIA
jgi:hypothetical protein